jgi:hypothetical protein
MSGPISSKPKTHIDDFKKAKEWLLFWGLFPLDPHDISPYDPDKDFRDYMVDDLPALIDNADYIYFLPGWWHSKGAWL